MQEHVLTPLGQTLAVLDTCVLLPPRLSDILFDLYLAGLYQPRWTDVIEQEFLKNWERVVTKNRAASAAGVSELVDKARKRLSAFQHATRQSYHIYGADDSQVKQRVPPKVDAKDSHVIAAAFCLQDELAIYDQSESDSAGMLLNSRIFVVTENVKHMAVKDCQSKGIEVIKPGRFIDLLYEANNDRVINAMDRVLASLKNPPYTREKLIEVLQQWGAKKTAAGLAKRHSLLPQNSLSVPVTQQVPLLRK